uniref:Uncharacterized protein n=1 Tax=Anguilla anguilla TaxID=7936 RepID=A0A0E9QRK0_ANGAN
MVDIPWRAFCFIFVSFLYCVLFFSPVCTAPFETARFYD